jgi:hypothetical protein
MEARSVRADLLKAYKRKGYTPVNEWLCIVWDGTRFSNHVEALVYPSPFGRWSEDFTPPILYYNTYVWIYSPGPPPNLALY